jgi:hypothetical protein
VIKSCDPALFHTTSQEKGKHMLEHIFVRKGVIAQLRQSPLGLHLDHLATSLHNEGYASIIVQRYLLTAEKFAYWLQG